MQYRLAYLLGRCANGAERDSGLLVHAVPTDAWKALCGKTYGRHSAGWHYQDEPGYFPSTTITCAKCAEKAAKSKSVAA